MIFLLAILALNQYNKEQAIDEMDRNLHALSMKLDVEENGNGSL